MYLRLCVSECTRVEAPISHTLDYGWPRSKDTPLPLPHGKAGRISQLYARPNLGTKTHNHLPLVYRDRKIQFDLPSSISQECLLGLKWLLLTLPSVNVDSVLNGLLLILWLIPFVIVWKTYRSWSVAVNADGKCLVCVALQNLVVKSKYYKGKRYMCETRVSSEVVES